MSALYCATLAAMHEKNRCISAIIKEFALLLNNNGIFRVLIKLDKDGRPPLYCSWLYEVIESTKIITDALLKYGENPQEIVNHLLQRDAFGRSIFIESAANKNSETYLHLKMS